MEVPVIAAIIAGLVSLVSAAGTLWSSARTNANANAIKLLEIESDRQNPLLSAKSEISNFSEPLPRSAYDLQSRLYNSMRRNLIQVYFVKGDERTKSYVVNNTVYLVAQFQRITELMRQKRSNLSTLERAREHANSCSYKIK